MSSKLSDQPVVDTGEASQYEPRLKANGHPDSAVKSQEVYEFSDTRKLGVTSAVFLILNKMIGTGSEYTYLFQSARGHRAYTR